MDEFEIGIKIQLSEKWKINLNWGWFPIDSTTNPLPGLIQTFQQRHFEAEADQILREAIFTDLGISEVIVLEETMGYEQCDIWKAELYYTGLEKMVTDKNATFCLYGSHESSFTVGSRRLLSILDQKWGSYSKRIWTTPFYE